MNNAYHFQNCKNVLESTGILDMFDAIVDGVILEEAKLPGKPKPDMFLRYNTFHTTAGYFI